MPDFTIEAANELGNIYCLDANQQEFELLPDTLSSATKTCYVAIADNVPSSEFRQEVELAQQRASPPGTFYEPEQTTYHIKELIFDNNASIRFLNTLSPLSDAGQPAIKVAEESQGGDDHSDPGLTDKFSNSHNNIEIWEYGGNGGQGGWDDMNWGINQRKKGGAGGAGGNGGLMFRRGSWGGDGARGVKGNNPDTEYGPADYDNSLWAGANVLINTTTLKFQGPNANNPNGRISILVSGRWGRNNVQGSWFISEDDVAGGNAGGGGGAGGGRLTIIAEEIIGQGKLSARGGDGGNGGQGGKTDDSSLFSDGGGGGAGGAGQGGQIYIRTDNYPWQNNNYFITSSGVSGSFGEAGNPGNTNVQSGNTYERGHEEPGKPAYPADIRDFYPQAGVFLMLSEVDPENQGLEYERCYDGEDNDNDGRIDFADEDCWPQDPSDVEAAGGSPLGNVAIDGGPITHADFLNNQFPTQSWFNGTALNGSDAVCGDEDGCFFDYDCENNYDPAYCTKDTEFLACEDELQNCGDFQQYAYQAPNGCNNNAPHYCKDEYSFIDGGDLCVIKNSWQQNGESWSGYDCSQFFNEYHCDYYNTYGCTTTSGLGDAYPKPSTVTQCESYGAQFCTNAIECTWASDRGYVTPDDKAYFCSPDANGQKIVFPDNDFEWWYAKQSGVSFKIHHLDDNDYLSNGAEWYACNADGMQQSNANLLAAKQSPDSISTPGQLECTTLIEILGPDIWSGQDACEDPNYGLQPDYDPNLPIHIANTTNNEFCTDSNVPDGFCCEGPNGEVPVYDYSSGTSNLKECGVSCYYKAGTQVVDLNNLIPPPATMCTQEDFNSTMCQKVDPAFCSASASSGPTGPITNGYKLKIGEDCLDPAVCLGLNQQKPSGIACLDISYTQNGNAYVGTECGPQQYCGNGNYLDANDTNPGNGEVCCAVIDTPGIDVCEDLPQGQINPSLCAAMNGQYFSGMNQNDYTCTTGQVSGQCCIGGVWKENFQPVQSVLINDAGRFTCYAQNDHNRFAECCGSLGTCYNMDDNALFRGEENEDQFGYYGTGGMLHTVKNFDRPGQGLATAVQDMVLFAQLNTSNPRFTVYFGTSVDVLRLEDWEAFEHLEFDIVISEPNGITLNLSDRQGGSCLLANPQEYFITGNATYRWQHAVVPLDDCQGINKKQLFSLTIDSKKDVEVLMDNLFLSEESTSQDNTENLYCTGDFGTWIDNLDGPTDEGFIDVQASIAEYGPHKYACDAQNSFAWTGNVCCGDDTRRHYSQDVFSSGLQGPGAPATDIKSEYFADTYMGCFGGNPVESGEIVGRDALNDDNHNGLLFYAGEFHACSASYAKYSNHAISYNGESLYQTGNIFNPAGEPLVTSVAQPFTIHGDYICDPSGVWASADDIPISRIIASKFYNLTFENGQQHYEFEIRCNDPEDYYDPQGINNFPHANDVTAFCTYNYRATNSTNDPERILIGVALNDKVPISSFLEDTDLLLAGLNYDLPNITDVCATTSYGQSSASEFFQLCDNVTSLSSMEGLRIAYNPDFNILVIGVVSNHFTDFNGLFAPQGGIIPYFYNIWQQFINFFGNIFGAEEGAGYHDTLNLTAETLLPYVAEGDVTFNTTYLSKRGNKSIKAFYYVGEEAGSGIDLHYYTIEYTNFNQSMESLASDYFPDNAYSMNYLLGQNKQIFQLVNPLPHGFSEDRAIQGSSPGLREKKYAPEFDWRRLGPMLEIDPADYGPAKSGAPGNGIVDQGEFCDDDAAGNILFRFNDNSCKLWNATNETGNVTCSFPSRTLDHSNCV